MKSREFDGSNVLKTEEREESGPPPGFVDTTNYRFRLNPDGTKGEYIGTMPGFPEGWDDPNRLKKEGLMPEKGEDKMANKYDVDWKPILSRMAEIIGEREVSATKASELVKEEMDLPMSWGAIYSQYQNMLKREKQAPPQTQETNATSEPEPGTPEPAETSIPEKQPEETHGEEDTGRAREQELEDARFAEGFDELASKENSEQEINGALYGKPVSQYDPSDNDYCPEGVPAPAPDSYRMIETPADGVPSSQEDLIQQYAGCARMQMINHFSDMTDCKGLSLESREKLIASLLGWEVLA